MRVQVDYFSTYNMPSVCVGCGDPVGPYTYEVSKSNFSGKQIVGLKFPICEKCNAANKGSAVGLLGCLAGIVVAGVGGSIGGMLTSYIDLSWLPIIGAILGLVGGVILSRKIKLSSKPPEVRERLARLEKSVKMIGFNVPSLFGSKGWIKLEFADPAYGNQFRLLNGGKA